MRIGVGGWFLRVPNVGLGQYLITLLKGIDKLDNNNEYFLYVDKEAVDIKLSEKFKKINVKHPVEFLHKDIKKTLWEQYALPGAFKKEELDFIHIPYFAPIFRPPKTEIVSVLDVSPLRFTIKNMGKTGFYDKYYRELFFPLLKKAKLIIVCSHFLKREFSELTDISQDKIEVVHLCSADEYKVIDDADEIEKRITKYGINKKYIFSISEASYRKNLKSLTDAYMGLDEKIKEEYDLVICGSAKYSKKFQDIALMEPKNRIKLIGYASSDGDLPYLYNGADLFVFPSRYEGFGIPPLEAMKCGIPLVSNNITAIPEVVGDAGILVDTTDSEQIKNAVTKVLKDRALYDDLKEKGLERAKGFSIDRQAKETIEIYNSLFSR